MDHPDRYAESVAYKMSRLVPEVMNLVDLGVLHPFDAEWIGGLPPAKQMIAAKKFLPGAGTPVNMMFHYRSPERARLITTTRDRCLAGA